MKNINNCLGCGASKQTSDKDKIGYTIDLSHDYCYECFQLANYGKSFKHNHPDNYDNIKPGSLVLIIQSVMQLDLLFSLPIQRIQPDAKYIYIINQLDLLQKGTNIEHIYNNIHKQAYKNKVAYEDIIFMSALNCDDIENLKNYLIEQPIKDIYLFGFQNSGKTTILKGLTNNKTALNINKAGLTQQIIEEVLADKILYDMPGTYVKGYISDFLGYQEYSKMLPKKNIKPKVIQLKNSQKLVINDFIEISYKGIEQTSIVIYLNDFNKIMKYNLKNENNYLSDKFEYVNKQFKLQSNKKTQITIADLLFIHFTDDININVKLPKNMHITSIESLIK